MMTQDVIVIGAGVVGLSAALALQGARPRGDGARPRGRRPAPRRANAGAFAFSDILPLASPGLFRKVPGWLVDPLGPLSIPPRHAPRHRAVDAALRPCLRARPGGGGDGGADRASWTCRKPSSTLPRRHRHRRHAATRGQPPCLRGAGSSTPRSRLAGAGGPRDRVSPHGRGGGNGRGPAGPRPRFTHGTFTPGWFSVADPGKVYTEALAARVVANGGTLVRPR